MNLPSRASVLAFVCSVSLVLPALAADEKSVQTPAEPPQRKEAGTTDLGQPQEPKQKVKTLVVREQKRMVLTGSHIPRTVGRVGRITDAPSPVTVIDREQIQRSGAQTLADVLRTDPSITIKSGGR